MNAPEIDGFEIISQAGSGGMSVVWKATQTSLGRTVAIKFLHPHLITNAVSLQRFMQEGKVATTLHHPNVAQIFSCGATKEDRPYLVMEFIEGQSLKDLIDQRQGLPPPEAVRIFEGILAGLQALHAAGIIHRDLKPGNVMLVADDSGATMAKIVDFGIAKVSEIAKGEMQRLTQTGAVVGSPSYMSPEQCVSAAVDARSDIYALGCMLYEALTCRLPFESDNLLELMTQHLNQSAPAPSAVAKQEIPAQLDAIVLKCLEKSPEQRFGDCDELLRALQAVDFEQMAAPGPLNIGRRNGATNWKIWASLAAGMLLVLLAVSGYSLWSRYQRHAQIDSAMQAIRDGRYQQARMLLEQIDATAMDASEKSKLVQTEYFLGWTLCVNGDKDERDRVTQSLQLQNLADGNYLVAGLKVGHDPSLAKTKAFEQAVRSAQSDPAVGDRNFLLALMYLRRADLNLPGESHYSLEKRATRCLADYNKAFEFAEKTRRPDLMLYVLAERLAFEHQRAFRKEAASDLQRAKVLIPQAANQCTYEGTAGILRVGREAEHHENWSLLKLCYNELIKNRQYKLPIALQAEVDVMGGVILFRQQKWEQALSYFEKAKLALGRRFDEYRAFTDSEYYSALCQYKLKQYARGVALMNSALCHAYRYAHYDTAVDLRAFMELEAQTAPDKEIAAGLRHGIAETDVQIMAKVDHDDGIYTQYTSELRHRGRLHAQRKQFALAQRMYGRLEELMRPRVAEEDEVVAATGVPVKHDPRGIAATRNPRDELSDALSGLYDALAGLGRQQEALSKMRESVIVLRQAHKPGDSELQEREQKALAAGCRI